MGKKVILIALANKFGSKVGETIASDFDLFFLNIEDYIEYCLVDKYEMVLKCGKEYFLKQELSAIKDCVEFENTIYYCSYEIFSLYKDYFQDFLKIYIKLNEKQLEKLQENNYTINKIAYDDRNLFLSSNCQIVENEYLVAKVYANQVATLIKGQK